jgi:hypothetical protein
MKVSVVVPTYATPQEGLDRLIASLDRQSMPADQFEVIFVDDGSPDGTVARLRELASTRAYVRVVRMANSGWPSKPRNHGTDLATGEYVAYMDHDDELGPDALRAAYEFAVANDADVVNGKEAYTHRGNWALATYIGDLGQALDRTDTHPLLPMNPHKLYRRAFLQEHGIRFREGRKVLWEDILFNIQVGRHAKVISTLSSVPYYHWAETEGSGSTLFTKWADDYWAWLREVIATAESELAEPRLETQREQVVRHQYAGRVIRSFDAGFARRPVEAKTFIFEHARALQADFGLDSFDSSLTAAQRARAQLLRENRLDLLTTLCAEEPQPVGQGTATSIRWEDGVLRVEADVAWADPKGRRHAVREGGRIVRSYSPEVDEALPVAQRDITGEVSAASIGLAVRSRADRFVWLAPSTDEIVVTDGDDGAVSLSGRMTSAVDPETAAMGRPLSPGYWDLLVRAQLSGETNARALRSDLAASVTVTAGRLHLVYPNDGGAATVFIDAAEEAVRRLRPLSARLTDQGELEIELDGTHDGTGEVPTTVGIDQSLTGKAQWTEHPATLTVEGGRAVLRFAPAGDRVRVRVGDRAGVKGSRKPWLAVSVTDGEVVYGDLAALKQNPKIRVLLLTNRDSDNVGDQLIEASAISLVKGVMKNLGVAADGYAISSRAAGIVPKAYLASRDPSLLEDARKAIANADILLFGGAPLFNYTYQQFYLRTIITLELAEEYGVPVLFSSIGVEPFDETNAKSLALREALELRAPDHHPRRPRLRRALRGEHRHPRRPRLRPRGVRQPGLRRRRRAARGQDHRPRRHPRGDLQGQRHLLLRVRAAPVLARRDRRTHRAGLRLHAVHHGPLLRRGLPRRHGQGQADPRGQGRGDGELTGGVERGARRLRGRDRLPAARLDRLLLLRDPVRRALLELQGALLLRVRRTRRPRAGSHPVDGDRGRPGAREGDGRGRPQGRGLPDDGLRDAVQRLQVDRRPPQRPGAVHVRRAARATPPLRRHHRGRARREGATQAPPDLRELRQARDQGREEGGVRQARARVVEPAQDGGEGPPEAGEAGPPQGARPGAAPA